MRVASEGLLADVYQRFLRGSLARLALHPSANFVVQAYLAALHGSQQVLPVCSMHVARFAWTCRPSRLRCMAPNRYRLFIACKG